MHKQNHKISYRSTRVKVYKSYGQLINTLYLGLDFSMVLCPVMFFIGSVTIEIKYIVILLVGAIHCIFVHNLQVHRTPCVQL